MKKQVDCSLVLSNPHIPRIIKDRKFYELVNSIKSFPQMLEKRPIVVDESMMVLGGNMRLKACKEAGFKKVWVDIAEGWTDEQKKEFTIKDNVGFGEWDWDILANDWDEHKISDWGLDVWKSEEEVDYSILDDDDLSDELQDLNQGVKKAIQIEFALDHYEEASSLIKFWRDKTYVGYMILDFLRSEKEKL